MLSTFGWLYSGFLFVCFVFSLQTIISCFARHLGVTGNLLFRLLYFQFSEKPEGTISVCSLLGQVTLSHEGAGKEHRAEQKGEGSWERRAAWLQAASSGRSSAQSNVQLLARAATRGQRALPSTVTPPQPQPPPGRSYFRPPACSQLLWGGAARFLSSQKRWWARLSLSGQNQSYEQSVLLFSSISSLSWGFSCVTWRCGPKSFLCLQTTSFQVSWMKQAQLVAWALFRSAVGQQSYVWAQLCGPWKFTDFWGKQKVIIFVCGRH